MNSAEYHQEKIDAALEKKYHTLCDYLSQIESIAVAFSGGVDSALLLKIAHDVLKQRVLAITAKSPVFPDREIAATNTFCDAEDICHIVFDSHASEDEIFKSNPPDRCYFCKKALLGEIVDRARNMDINVIAEGSNLDDENDYRPGLAALRESNVISPLRQSGFTKNDIRILARNLGLPMWNKPSFACLATRIPYGQRITAAKLDRIDAAERIISDLGFSQVRVRCNNECASIEVEPSEITHLEQLCKERDIFRKLKELGFCEVKIDPKGYVSGNLNRLLIDAN